MNLDKIVQKFTDTSFLAKLFVIWLIVNVVGIAVSVSFITNVASIAAVPAPVEVAEETGERGLLKEDLLQNPGEGVSLAPVLVLPERLVIDELEIDLPVVNPQTTDITALDKELMNGAVRYPTSGMLGENGRNIVIFGHSARVPTHRGMYRAFNDIEKLAEGETVALQGGNLDGQAKEYVYRVSRVYKKNAETAEIELAGANNKLTLVTCDGFGKRSDRWIVEADFIGAYDL